MAADRILHGLLMMTALAATAIRSHAAPAADDIVVKIVMLEDEAGKPAATGKAVAESLKAAMGSVPLKAVIVSECFENRQAKEQALAGICSVLPSEIVMGGATYGSFTQRACTDVDSVCLLGLGGEGLSVSAQLVTNMGTAKLTVDENRELIAQRLHAAGESLAQRLHRSDRDRLLILIADAHAPKNQFLVEGLQKVVGKNFPITGGCVNKNAGQTYVYFGGRMHEDSAIALLLAGDFRVSLAGRQANVNEKVIATAKEGAQQALAAASGRPVAALAFNCAGRRSKLKKYEDELAAMQDALGKNLPLFGCYCAGEMGPVDDAQKPSDALSGGSGWHVMFTIISR
jgi:hypothetical protein